MIQNSKFNIQRDAHLVIVGTTGLDNIETPFGKVEGALGGSGIYAALAASYFTTPGLVSIAGEDFPDKYLKILNQHSIDLEGLEKSGKTFAWSGLYEFDMNEAKTLKTELNSLSNFTPKLPLNYKNPEYLLLANFDPSLQLEVLDQIESKPFIVLDTMNYWIGSQRPKLLEVIKKVNLVVLNEGEARQLLSEPNLIKAGRKLLELGPEYVVIKKGEHGALLFSLNGFFSAPGYPLEELKDPTGCGDSFAGGLIGYLASHKNKETNFDEIKRAVIYGSSVASCCAEQFSTDYRNKIIKSEIEERYHVFEEIRKF